MNNIIKELWHGNIVPQSDSRNNSPEMKQLARSSYITFIEEFNVYSRKSVTIVPFGEISTVLTEL